MKPPFQPFQGTKKRHRLVRREIVLVSRLPQAVD